ncbi:hypothetical protein [uncultured Gimesia sp.]|uniref:tetratricopeptide repeat protein n=1 Tax=uncultured Gimesia sp. TaxID=1678688 RepID=UPI0030DDDD6E|tara:strand:- start:11782 stop:12618 length:837 start_codon:yes stop_codon:yes gene_type:complete
MSAEDESQDESGPDLREFSVGVRIDPDEGLRSLGMEVVNGVINLGGKVVSIQGGDAAFRKLNQDEDQESVAFSGCDIKVIMDVSGVADSPISKEHDRLYRAGLDLINPYMRLVGRDARPVDSELARKELAQGKELLKCVLEINQGNGAAWWLIGKAEQALGDAEAACDAFGDAYRLKNENPDTAREYMFECLKLGRTKEAIAAARHAKRLKPGDMGLVANLGLALLIGGELDEAAATIEEALTGTPDDPISANLKQVIEDIRAGLRPQPQNLGDLKQF